MQIVLQGVTVTVTLNFVDACSSEDGWEVHYNGDKRGSNIKRSKSGLDVTFPAHYDWKIASISLQNMLDVFKVG